MPERAIRFALQMEKEFTYKGGAFRFTLNGYSSDYIPAGFYTAMPPGFYNRRFKILYNPNDPSEVDLYSTEDIYDKTEGLIIGKNEYICTLKSIKELGIEKQKMVALHNKTMRKLTRKISQEIIPLDINAAINEHSQLIDAPRIVKRKIEEIIEREKPLEKIAERAQREVEYQLEYKKDLSMEDLTELNERLKKELSDDEQRR